MLLEASWTYAPQEIDGQPLPAPVATSSSCGLTPPKSLIRTLGLWRARLSDVVSVALVREVEPSPETISLGRDPFGNRSAPLDFAVFEPVSLVDGHEPVHFLELRRPGKRTV